MTSSGGSRTAPTQIVIDDKHTVRAVREPPRQDRMIIAYGTAVNADFDGRSPISADY